MIRFVWKNPLLLAWFISLIGCFVSVYFREVLHIEPCPLCWYQRMALFPLVIILGMALYRGDGKVTIYLFPFALFGLLVAVYQVLGGYFPRLLYLGLCGDHPHCSSSIFSFFGFLTLPMLSGLGFAAITLLLFVAISKTKK